MLTKIKNYSLYLFHNLTDIRVIGQIIFAGLVLIVSWSCVGAIQTNADLQKQIAQLQQKNELQKLQNENLQLSTAFLNTDQYLELSARRQFGKAAPGEKVIIVPKNVALAHSIDTTVHVNTKPADAPHQPFYEYNLEAWRDFFFHRDS